MGAPKPGNAVSNSAVSPARMITQGHDQAGRLGAHTSKRPVANTCLRRPRRSFGCLRADHPICTATPLQSIIASANTDRKPHCVKGLRRSSSRHVKCPSGAGALVLILDSWPSSRLSMAVVLPHLQVVRPRFAAGAPPGPATGPAAGWQRSRNSQPCPGCRQARTPGCWPRSRPRFAGAELTRTGGAAATRRRRVQPRHQQGALHQPAHRRAPRRAHLGQARRHQPHLCRGLRPHPRTARLNTPEPKVP